MNVLDHKFNQLTDGQRKTVHLIAQGRTDEYLASGSQIDIGAHCAKVMEIFRVLNIGGADYAQKRLRLVQMGRQFFNLGEPMPEEPAPQEKVVPTPLPQQAAVQGNSLRETEQSSSAGEAAALPSVEVLSERIARLSEKDKGRLKIIANAPRGDRTHTAVQMGLSAVSIGAVMVPIYKRIGLPNMPGRKELLKQACRLLERKEMSANIKAKATPEHEASQEPAPIYKEVQRQIEHATAPQLEHASAPASPPSSGGFGSGVVIPIPADVSEVEVLSGEFTRNNPSASLKADIIAKKNQGLRPQLLVLYPSPQDPTVALGHIVFFHKEGE